MITVFISVAFGIGGSMLISVSFADNLKQERKVAINSYQSVLGMLAVVNSVSHQAYYGDVVDVLRQLEENGLVERIPDPGDHRKALVRLTDKGEAIRLKAEDRMREYMHRVIDRVGEETFARMLDDLSTWEQAMQAELAREE